MADGIKLKQEREDDEPFADGALEDDPLDEAGDLEFFDKTSTDPNYDNMYLARVPNYVWEAWDKLPDDSEIEIGRIRQWTETVDGVTKVRLRMLLHNTLGEHQLLPKEYELKITEMSVKDTFIFSEEDLPHFKEKNKARQQASAAGIPAHLLRAKVEKPAAPKPTGRRGPRKEFYRKAIPKKTKIAGRVKHELNCIPVENPETDHILALRAIEASKPKSVVTFIDEDKDLTMSDLNRRTIAEHAKYQNFIQATAPPPPTKQKKMEMKTIRIPENELVDQIFRCFGKYSYWSMKALRRELQQPEAYLRQTLEKVAHLHKTGSFANTWSLTEDSKRSRDVTTTSDTQAPETNADESDGEDEGADVQMEDVV